MKKNFFSSFWGSNEDGNVSAAIEQETAPVVFPRIELKQTIPICGHKLYLAQNAVGWWGVIRRNFEIIVPFEYEKASTFSPYADKKAAYLNSVQQNKTCLVLGKCVYKLNQYYSQIWGLDSAEYLGAKKRESSCGVLHLSLSKATEIIPCEYERITPVSKSNLCAFVAQNNSGAKLLIDLKGRRQYENLADYHTIGNRFQLLYPEAVNISTMYQVPCSVYSLTNGEIILQNVIFSDVNSPHYWDHFIILQDGDKWYLAADGKIVFCGNKYIKPIEKSLASYPLQFLTVDDNGFEIVRHINGQIIE